MSQTSDTDTESIPDIMKSQDTRQIPIDQVGVKGIRHPVVVNDRSGKEQHTVANFNMYVALPADFKGTHMSRFLELLNQHEEEITVESFRSMLKDMGELLEAKSGTIEMEFPYFVMKKAPVSGVKSIMDYDVTFVGQLESGKSDVLVKVLVPITSLCPCSKKISDYGAHNQRSHVTVCVKTREFVWIEELIDYVESIASCQLYGILKRPDEKYVTEHAYDNPKFVEDIVRDVAVLFNQDDRIAAYSVESENFESIHNHSAYAKVLKDKDKS